MISSLSNGNFVEFDISVASSSQYTFAARVTSPTYSGQLNLQINGNAVCGCPSHTPAEAGRPFPPTFGSMQDPISFEWRSHREDTK